MQIKVEVLEYYGRESVSVFYPKTYWTQIIIEIKIEVEQRISEFEMLNLTCIDV